MWIKPDEPVASAHVYLASVGLLSGDLPGAEADLAQAARRAEGLGFPQGPHVRAMACYVEIGCASKPVSSTRPGHWQPT